MSSCCRLFEKRRVRRGGRPSWFPGSLQFSCQFTESGGSGPSPPRGKARASSGARGISARRSIRTSPSGSNDAPSRWDFRCIETACLNLPSGERLQAPGGASGPPVPRRISLTAENSPPARSRGDDHGRDSPAIGQASPALVDPASRQEAPPSLFAEICRLSSIWLARGGPSEGWISSVEQRKRSVE